MFPKLARNWAKIFSKVSNAIVAIRTTVRGRSNFLENSKLRNDRRYRYFYSVLELAKLRV